MRYRRRRNTRLQRREKKKKVLRVNRSSEQKEESAKYALLPKKDNRPASVPATSISKVNTPTVHTKKLKGKPIIWYQEIIDGIAAAKKRTSVVGRKKQKDITLDARNRLLKLVKAIHTNLPVKTIQMLVKKYINGGGEVDYSLRRVLSEEMKNKIAARLYLLGLKKEADQLRKHYKSYNYISITDEAEHDATYWKTVTELAINQIQLSTGTAQQKAFNGLHQVLIFIGQKVASLYKDVDWSGNFSTFIRLSKFSTKDQYYFYKSLFLKLYTATQIVHQKQLDMAVLKLNDNGGHQNIRMLHSNIKKLQKIIQPAPLYILKTNLTRSVFSLGKKERKTHGMQPKDLAGKHLDFFDRKNKQAPSAAINFYDWDRKSAKEAKVDLATVLHRRNLQLRVLARMYKIAGVIEKKNNPKAQKISLQNRADNQQLIKTFNGNFNLHSVKDWRDFVLKKYEMLTGKRKLTKGQAFSTIITLLKQYMQAFNVGTPYNIYDKGTFKHNYLNARFPRALTGQIIQDCGVFALRIAYILSVLRKKIDLQFYFIHLPNHIGLIMLGKGIPAFVAHNNNFGRFGRVKSLTKPGANAKQYTFQEWKNCWKHNFSKGCRSKKANLTPRQNSQFLGEMATSLFMAGNVNIPFRLQKLPKMKGKTADRFWGDSTVKQSLWKTFQKRTKPLFGDKVYDKQNAAYKFHLKYLDIGKKQKEMHEVDVANLWYGNARNLWYKVFSKKFNDIVSKLLLDKNNAQLKTKYAATVLLFKRALIHQLSGIEKTMEEVRTMRSEVNQTLDHRNRSGIAANSTQISKGSRAKEFTTFKWHKTKQITTSYSGYPWLRKIVQHIEETMLNPLASGKTLKTIMKRLTPPFVNKPLNSDD
jgi:hypothetical protein